MVSLLNIHKNKDKAEAKEFAEKKKQINIDFLHFQMEKGVRATISNIYQNNEVYPPNILVDLITEASMLDWRPMKEEERLDLQNKLAKESGIVIAQK